MFGTSEFYLFQTGICQISPLGNFSYISVESKTRTFHEQVGSKRTAGRRDEAGQNEARQTSSPRRQASLVPPRMKRLLDVFSKNTNNQKYI